MKWHKVDLYHMRFGNTGWHISWARGVPLPFTLFNDGVRVGSFADLQQAIAKHKELSEHA